MFRAISHLPLRPPTYTPYDVRLYPSPHPNLQHRVFDLPSRPQIVTQTAKLQYRVFTFPPALPA